MRSAHVTLGLQRIRKFMVRVLAGGSFALALLICCGCPGGVGLRPDGSPGPEECSNEAQRMMEALRLRVGDAALVQMDVKQEIDASPITLYDGPVESLLLEPFGTLERGTRLYGRVWTSGPQVIVRYYQAQAMAGQRVPICAVARIGDNQLRKLPESKPGMALLEFPKAVAYVVSAFRS